MLGVDFAADQIVWQDYNPYPKAEPFHHREFVFVGDGCGAKEPFNPTDADHVRAAAGAVPLPGLRAKLNASDLEFTPLAPTGEKTGTVVFGDLMQMSPFGRGGGLNPARRQIPTNVSYVLAAHIQGKVKTSPADDAEKKGDDKKAGKKDEAKKPHQSTINVVVVADIDMLSQDFFRIREQGDTPEMGINFSFDNVTFVLNALDALAGDKRFIDIRKRRLQHRTLARIEERTREAKQEATDARDQFSKDFDAEEQKEQKAIDDKMAELKKRKNMDIQQMAIEVALMQQSLEQQRQTKLAQLRAEKDQKIKKIETELALKVKQVQDRYKMWAVLLPPIPPLLVAAYRVLDPPPPRARGRGPFKIAMSGRTDRELGWQCNCHPNMWISNKNHRQPIPENCP